MVLKLKHNYYSIGIYAVIGFVVLITASSQYDKTLTDHIRQQNHEVTVLNNKLATDVENLNYTGSVPDTTVGQIKQQTKFILTRPDTLNNAFHKTPYRDMLVVDVGSNEAKDWLKDANITTLPTDPVVVSTSHKTTYAAKNVSFNIKSIPASSSITQNNLTNEIANTKRKVNTIKKHRNNNRVFKKILHTIDYVAFFGVLVLSGVMAFITNRQREKE